MSHVDLELNVGASGRGGGSRLRTFTEIGESPREQSSGSEGWWRFGNYMFTCKCMLHVYSVNACVQINVGGYVGRECGHLQKFNTSGVESLVNMEKQFLC